MAEWYNTMFASLMGFFGGMLVLTIVDSERTITVPEVDQVQKGYLHPDKIDGFECRDLDENEELETYFKVEGKHYLLREIDGEPVLMPYKVKPPEIVPEGD